MNKRTRIWIVLTALAVAFVLLSSLAFITLEADHDCAGEGCYICTCINACQQLLKLLTGVVTAAAAVFAALPFLCFACFVLEQTASRCTLVSLKVKLSD